MALVAESTSSAKMTEQKRVGRWYFGGLSSAGAACITHPIDLIKVHLQTQQTGKLGILQTTMQVVRRDGRKCLVFEHLYAICKSVLILLGFFALYNGISASLLRQLTYSTTRFGIYEMAKQSLGTTQPSFGIAVSMAALAGAAGGLVGTPGDMINVRMQNDMKLPPEQRRK